MHRAGSIQGCHGGSLAGNVSASRSSISDSRAMASLRRAHRSRARGREHHRTGDAPPYRASRPQQGHPSRRQRQHRLGERFFRSFFHSRLPSIAVFSWPASESGFVAFARQLQMPSQKHSSVQARTRASRADEPAVFVCSNRRRTGTERNDP
jgi:hypothetical protein